MGAVEDDLGAMVMILVLGIVSVIYFGGNAFFPVALLLALMIPVLVYLGASEDEAAENAGDEAVTADAGTGRDPIEELRQRYARGEITEAEMERRLGPLLESAADPPGDADRVSEGERELLRERE